MVKETTFAPKSMQAQDEAMFPFFIFKDYRKTLKLRKQRELRKKKMIKEREIIKEIKQEEKKMMIEQINRSMLDQDDVWSRVQSEVKIETAEECYTADNNEGNIDRKIQQLRMEVLFAIGTVNKKSIFPEAFEKFDFPMC